MSICVAPRFPCSPRSTPTSWCCWTSWTSRSRCRSSCPGSSCRGSCNSNSSNSNTIQGLFRRPLHSGIFLTYKVQSSVSNNPISINYVSLAALWSTAARPARPSWTGWEAAGPRRPARPWGRRRRPRRRRRCCQSTGRRRRGRRQRGGTAGSSRPET